MADIQVPPLLIPFKHWLGEKKLEINPAASSLSASMHSDDDYLNFCTSTLVSFLSVWMVEIICLYCYSS